MTQDDRHSQMHLSPQDAGNVKGLSSYNSEDVKVINSKKRGQSYLIRYFPSPTYRKYKFTHHFAEHFSIRWSEIIMRMVCRMSFSNFTHISF